MKRRLVNLETPFAGNVPRNLRFARACMAHAISLGEAPIASYLLYTQEGILDDRLSEERETGIACGLAWNAAAEATVVYTDLGISDGMKLGIRDAENMGRGVEYRTLGWVDNPPTKADGPVFTMRITPGDAKAEDIAALYEALNDLYRHRGGSGNLKFDLVSKSEGGPS